MEWSLIERSSPAIAIQAIQIQSQDDALNGDAPNNTANDVK